MRVKFIGNVNSSFGSVPAGVIVTFRPGEEKVVDGGFDYLKSDDRFEVLDEKEQPGDEEKSRRAKAKSKSDE
jgi:hypothetical protein